MVLYFKLSKNYLFAKSDEWVFYLNDKKKTLYSNLYLRIIRLGNLCRVARDIGNLYFTDSCSLARYKCITIVPRHWECLLTSSCVILSANIFYHKSTYLRITYWFFVSAFPVHTGSMYETVRLTWPKTTGIVNFVYTTKE